MKRGLGVQLGLCGLPPKVIMDIANKAIEFYGYQKEVESEFKLSKYMRREEQFNQLDKNFQERILDASNKITLLTHQLESAKSERDTDRKELQDLKEKYAEKSRCVCRRFSLPRAHPLRQAKAKDRGAI